MHYDKTYDKRQEALDQIKHTCRCSCRVYIPVYVDSVVCKWCGKRIYRTPRLEFEAKLKNAISKGKNCESIRV